MYKAIFVIVALWAGVSLVGCTPAAAPSEAAASEAAASEAANNSISVAAWSLDGNFRPVADSFLAQAPTPWIRNGPGQSSTVVFQTGHADATTAGTSGSTPWEVIPDDALYVIQAMCETMAHGPRQDCNGEKPRLNYGCPVYWSEIWDSELHRNVYARWGQYLLENSDMRMACGSSTLYTPKVATVSHFWGLLGTPDSGVAGMAQLSIADALTSGLADVGVNVCVTLGGATASESPLMTDTAFVALPNQDAGGYFHLQYSEPFLGPYSEDPVFYQVEDVMPESVSLFFHSQGPMAEQSTLLFPRCLPTLQLDPSDGRETISPGERKIDQFAMSGSEEGYWKTQEGGKEGVEERLISSAQSQIAEYGWFDREEFSGDFAYGEHILLVIAPTDDDFRAGAGVEVTHKTSFVTFRRRIDLNTIPWEGGDDERRIQDATDVLSQTRGTPLLPVIGAGGRIDAYLNPDGTLISAQLVARPIAGVSSWLQMRSPEVAYLLALGRLSGDFGFLVEGIASLERKEIDPDDLIAGVDLHGFDGDSVSLDYVDPFYLDRILSDISEYDKGRYRLDRWTWGYAEPEIQYELAEELTIWYNFVFVPTDDSYPKTPISIWAPGQLDMACE